MRAVSDAIARIEKVLAVVLMFAMTVTVAISVIFRYMFNSPITGAGELSIFFLIWISFIGGSLGLKYRTQATVTILMDYVSERIKFVILIIGYLLMIAFLIVLLYYSYKWILSPNVAVQRSTSLLLPMWIPYSVIPLSFSFATIHLLTHLLDLIRGGNTT